MADSEKRSRGELGGTYIALLAAFASMIGAAGAWLSLENYRSATMFQLRIEACSEIQSAIIDLGTQADDLVTRTAEGADVESLRQGREDLSESRARLVSGIMKLQLLTDANLSQFQSAIIQEERELIQLVLARTTDLNVIQSQYEEFAAVGVELANTCRASLRQPNALESLLQRLSSN